MASTIEPTLVDMVRYNTWASRTLLTFCRGLTAETLLRAIDGTYGTIPDTFLHLVHADTAFLGVFALDLPADLPVRGTALDLAGIDALFERIAPFWEAAARKAIAENVVFETPRGAVRAGFVLAQLLNHGSEHRTQIQSLLSVAGIEAPLVDGWVYGGMRR